MDDYLDSYYYSLDEAIERVEQVNIINNHAGFVMHGWASNHASVVQNVQFAGNDQQVKLIKSDLLNDKAKKVLGLRWINSTDNLIFNLNFSKIPQDMVNGAAKPAKVQFLAIVMSIFDPLGFLIPVTIQARLLMQAIWASKVHWNDGIKDDEFKAWKEWLQVLKKIKSVRVNRCYQLLQFQVKQAELHVF